MNELDGHDHVADDAIDHLLPVKLAEVAEWRAGIVVHQDVRLGAGGEQRLLAFRRGDIGHHRRDLGAGRLAQFVGGGGKAIFVEAVDHHLAAGLGQAVGAGAAEPAAGSANDRLAARNPKVHA